MEQISELELMLGDCPIKPIPSKEMKTMLAKAMIKEFGETSGTKTATGPELIETMLYHNREHASAIMWSLMSVAMNLLVSTAKVEKPEEPVQ